MCRFPTLANRKVSVKLPVDDLLCRKMEKLNFTITEGYPSKNTKTQQPVETYLGPEHLEHLPKHKVVQNGDTRDNKNLSTDRGVGNLHRFQGRILPHTNSQSVRFHIQGRSYQFKAPPFGLSTAPMEFTVVAKEVKLMALQKGIRIYQYLDDWLVRATSYHVSSIHRSWLLSVKN